MSTTSIEADASATTGSLPRTRKRTATQKAISGASVGTRPDQVEVASVVPRTTLSILGARSEETGRYRNKSLQSSGSTREASASTANGIPSPQPTTPTLNSTAVAAATTSLPPQITSSFAVPPTTGKEPGAAAIARQDQNWVIANHMLSQVRDSSHKSQVDVAMVRAELTNGLTSIATDVAELQKQRPFLDSFSSIAPDLKAMVENGKALAAEVNYRQEMLMDMVISTCKQMAGLEEAVDGISARLELLQSALTLQKEAADPTVEALVMHVAGLTEVVHTHDGKIGTHRPTSTVPLASGAVKQRPVRPRTISLEELAPSTHKFAKSSHPSASPKLMDPPTDILLSNIKWGEETRSKVYETNIFRAVAEGLPQGHSLRSPEGFYGRKSTHVRSVRFGSHSDATGFMAAFRNRPDVLANAEARWDPATTPTRYLPDLLRPAMAALSSPSENTTNGAASMGPTSIPSLASLVLPNPATTASSGTSRPPRLAHAYTASPPISEGRTESGPAAPDLLAIRSGMALLQRTVKGKGRTGILGGASRDDRAQAFEMEEPGDESFYTSTT